MPSPKTGNSVILFQNKGIAVQLCLIEIERWSAMIDVQMLIGCYFDEDNSTREKYF